MALVGSRLGASQSLGCFASSLAGSFRNTSRVGSARSGLLLGSGLVCSSVAIHPGSGLLGLLRSGRVCWLARHPRAVLAWLHMSRLNVTLCALGLSGLACDGVSGPLLLIGQGGAGTGGAPIVASAGSAGNSQAFSPLPGTSWQAQLSGTIDTELDVELFYLDADVAGKPALTDLLVRGRHVVCYLSAGTFEPWRNDADQFPAGVLGDELDQYPDERWLDVRDSVVRGLMQERIARLRAAGCEGVVPASLNGHEQDRKFGLTAADAVEYAVWLGQELHAQGMSAGLSVPGDLLPALAGAFDWGLAVGCLSTSGCAGYVPVRQRDRAVLLVEFGDEGDLAEVCAGASARGFDALVKRPNFDAFRLECP